MSLYNNKLAGFILPKKKKKSWQGLSKKKNGSSILGVQLSLNNLSSPCGMISGDVYITHTFLLI